MTRSKELVFYSWIPLSPEVSRLSPYTHAHNNIRELQEPSTYSRYNPQKIPFRRPVRTPVSVLVKLPVGLQRSSSFSSQQNTFSNSGGLDLLHPKVVDLGPPYSQHHTHMLQYTSTLNYNCPVRYPVSYVPVG